MTMKPIYMLAIAIAALPLSSCAGRLNLVANASAQASATATAACGPTDNQPSILQDDDDRGSLRVDMLCTIATSGSGPAGQNKLVYQATLQNPFHVATIQGWQGTAYQSIVEGGAQLRIITPTGQQRRYWIQKDKHQDVTGSLMIGPFPVNLNLPAGTIFELKFDYAIPDVSKNCPNSCAFQETWMLNDSL